MAFNKPVNQGHKPYFNKQNRTASDQTIIRKLRTPFRKDLEMYGKVVQLMGSNQVKISCEDAQDRICRIPGKLFKHVWLKTNDIVIIKLWDFQPSKADVIWRYQGFQKTALEKRGELTKLYEFTHDEIVVPENFQEEMIEEDSDEFLDEE